MARRNRAAAAMLVLLVGGCATVPVAQAPAPAPVPAATVGAQSRTPDGVIGRTAAQLQALLGVPHARLSEGPARKLQFAGPVCVLDAYLYPQAAGREPAVTHVDTRRPTGEDIDRASCIAALRLR